ncbi:hypothetical protein BBJ28_00016725 [Nothophytophthora sp. Chile5]|nr:hypothetical protein BBJ28_00016725 [Nothophytophthora sp. Chile5]
MQVVCGGRAEGGAAGCGRPDAPQAMRPMLPRPAEDELLQATGPTAGRQWMFDCYYRVCHRGKSGGVAVRFKNNIASPVLGHVPLGRVFRATTPIYNEQGDPMVRLETPQLPSAVVRDEDKAEDGVERHLKEAWVPCRSIRNEVLLEPHRGPFLASQTSRFFRCVIEGCKVRAAADLTISELGYVLYGDVVEVVEAVVAPDGVVFLRLHDRYFDGPAWVVERSLDNESVLNEVEGAWSLSSASDFKPETYRCVQDSGAPVRTQPELSAPPVGRIPCGALVSVVQRIVTPQRQIFLRIVDTGASTTSDASKVGEQWVIETSTCCASVMTKVLSRVETALV